MQGDDCLFGYQGPPAMTCCQLLEALVALSYHARGWGFVFRDALSKCSALCYTDWLNKTYFMGISARNNHISFRHSARYQKILNLRPTSFSFSCTTMKNFCNILFFFFFEHMCAMLRASVFHNSLKKSSFKHFFCRIAS